MLRKTILKLPVVAMLSFLLAFPAFAAGGTGTTTNSVGNNTQTDVYRGMGVDGLGPDGYRTGGLGNYNGMNMNGTNGTLNRTGTTGTRGTMNRNNTTLGNTNGTNMNGVNNTTGTYRARATDTTRNNSNWGWLGLLGLAGLTGLFRGNNENRSRA